MEIKDLFIGVLSETLNIDESGVASLFNGDGSVKDDAKQTILGWHADHIKTVKSSSQKTSFDDGYKKATSEVMTKFENDIKAKTGIKSDKKGIDLVLEYAASQKTEGAITDDAVKRHPLYLTLQEESEKKIQVAREEGEQKLTKFQSEIQKEKAFGTVAQKALEIFHSQKPILSKDPIKAKAQEELFLERFKGYDFEIQGDRIVVLKDGKLFENGHGNAVAFDKLVKETASTYYDFHVAETKTTPGHKTGAGNEGQTTILEVPKNDQEYAKVVNDQNIPVKDRLAIKEAYEKSKTTS